MQHKTVQAKATVTEQGTFTAIAAAYTVDRGNERVIPGAFQASIERWQASGKQIPLHWDHQGSPDAIVGTVDPAQVKETEAGLFVAGQLDLKGSEMAKEAWRSMKAGALGLSFGYLVLDGAKAKDGVYELKAVDLFEISITPAPMNADTKFLSLKAIRASVDSDELWSTDLVAIHGTIARRRKRLDEMEQMLIALERKDSATSQVVDELHAHKPSQDVQPPPANEDEDAPDEEPDGPTPKASDPEADQYELERIRALT